MNFHLPRSPRRVLSTEEAWGISPNHLDGEAGVKSELRAVNMDNTVYSRWKKREKCHLNHSTPDPFEILEPQKPIDLRF